MEGGQYIMSDFLRMTVKFNNLDDVEKLLNNFSFTPQELLLAYKEIGVSVTHGNHQVDVQIHNLIIDQLVKQETKQLSENDEPFMK
jgi:hypothetical protein